MKNKIIKTITAIAGAVWFLSLLTVDCVSLVPFAVFMLSTAWLAYVGWCNGWFEVSKNVHNR